MLRMFRSEGRCQSKHVIIVISELTDTVSLGGSLLGMSGATEQLALRMGQNAIKNGVCARR